MSVWTDLVGQDDAVAALRAAAQDAARIRRGEVSDGSMSHAWLFTGPPGSGRSVAARAFAAALQCPDSGCGHCQACATSLRGTHADVTVVVPDGLHLLIEQAREIIHASSQRPTQGHWQVTVIEDADRMEERTSNTVLKAIEEPPPHSVLLLCAPTAEELLPTIRSRCRLVALRTPSASAVAEMLIRQEGAEAAAATQAARAAQGHVGHARRLATDPAARSRRAEVLGLPRALRSVPACFQAADELVKACQAEAEAATADHDESETAALKQALGGGGTKGKGVASTAAPRGSAGALSELDRRQKSRGTRSKRDALDRALVDLAAYYRDVLTLQLGAGVPLVHGDHAEAQLALAQASSPEATLRRIDAVLAARVAIDAAVAPLLAVEAMALALHEG